MKWIKAILITICALLLALAILCILADLFGKPPDVVHAKSGQTVTELPSNAVKDSAGNLQKGVGGNVRPQILDGMRGFYSNAQVKRISSACGQILAGVRALSRSELLRRSLRRGFETAASVGRLAVETVHANQLPYEDYYTLLQIVEAEATGGDLRSKMLVANVVLNRVRDKNFPNTIQEVVWQNVEGTPQFSPTADGRIISCPITDSTVEAVRRVLNGEDESQGALFFIARSSADRQNVCWFDEKLEKLYSYGGHDFYTF